MTDVTSAYVLPFDADAATEHDLVGGKGANLGRLAAAGFPVPPGFTVTTAAYADFVAADGLAREIAALVEDLGAAGADELERVTATIRELVVGHDLPQEIATAVRAAYGTLGEGAYVAVRSSGTAEDLAGASFAGMHDTYLDIAGADAVLDAVKRCWASLWTARAASYRHTKGFDDGVGIAVVVQTMVPSEVSGVMFTANPLTSATDEIVINSSWGLGEAIVAGITTPDEYVVQHADLRVIERTLGSKEKRVVRDATTGSGTVVEDVPAAERERLTLSDEQAAQLADLGRRVQDHYDDVPQDTEWGYAGGEFLLLQSRPVTGVDFTWDAELEYWQERPPAPDDEVWTRGWSDAIWNGGCTPLMYTLRAHVYTDGQGAAMRVWGRDDIGGMRLYKYFKGTPYYNCSLEAEMVRTAFPSTRLGMTAMIPPAWHEEVLGAPFSLAAYLKVQARCQFLSPADGVATWRRTADRYLVDGVQQADGLPDEQLARLSDSELERHIDAMNRYDAEYMEDVWTAFLFQARDAMGLLGMILAKWYTGTNPTVFTDLITGVPRPTATQIENAALWDLAQAIRESPVLTEAFEQHDGAAFLEAAGDSEEGRAWLNSYATFLAAHGHRGHANRDIYHARRSEDPGLDHRSLAGFLAAGASQSPADKEHAVEARRQAVIAEVVENLRGKSFGGLRTELLQGTLDYVMMFLLFRDDERHWLDRVTFSIKRGFKEVGRRLVERGLLDGEEDFYFLSDRDLFAMLHSGRRAPLADARIAARRHHFVRMESGGTNPMYVQRDRDADLEFDRVPGEELPDGMFRGAGTSAGVVEGTARVVKALADIGRVREGEILVVNATDPGWTPVFLVIQAIVLETGGLLAHGSCLAREYGMPAVHLPRAMSLIPDGATVRVNGDAGTVEVLSAPDPAPQPAEAVPA